MKSPMIVTTGILTVGILTAGAVLCLSAVAAAETSMIRKAGEWEVTSSNPMGQGAPRTTKICFGSDKPVDDLTSGQLKNCEKKNTGASGNTVTVDAQCTLQGNMKVSVHGTIMMTGPDAYTSESRMHLEGGPPGMPTDVTITAQAHRTGPCQPGEEPR